MPSVLGTDPTAISTCEPVTVPPSSSCTVTSGPLLVALHGSRARQHRHAAVFEDSLDHGRRVRVLAGQHPVSRRHQRHLRSQCLVGTGELCTRDTGSDDDQVLGGSSSMS